MTFARCVMAAELGMDLDLTAASRDADLAQERFLFSESNARFLISTSARDAEELKRRFDGLPCLRIGTVTELPRLVARVEGVERICLDVERLKAAFKETLADE